MLKMLLDVVEMPFNTYSPDPIPGFVFTADTGTVDILDRITLCCRVLRCRFRRFRNIADLYSLGASTSYLPVVCHCNDKKNIFRHCPYPTWEKENHNISEGTVLD